MALRTAPLFACYLTQSSREWATLQEGMIALWRGWLPSVIGVIPYVGLNFSVYETLKDMTLKHYGEILPPPLPPHLPPPPARACPRTLACPKQPCKIYLKSIASCCVIEVAWCCAEICLFLSCHLFLCSCCSVLCHSTATGSQSLQTHHQAHKHVHITDVGQCAIVNAAPSPFPFDRPSDTPTLVNVS